jgi:hypothetical protein
MNEAQILQFLQVLQQIAKELRQVNVNLQQIRNSQVQIASKSGR